MLTKKIGRFHYIGYANRDDEFVRYMEGPLAGPFGTLQSAVDAIAKASSRQ